MQQFETILDLQEVTDKSSQIYIHTHITRVLLSCAFNTIQQLNIPSKLTLKPF